MIGEAWSWVKGHAAWIGGGMIAAIAAYYLFFSKRPSSSGAPSVVSFPTQSTGGGGGISGDGGVAPPPAVLPVVPPVVSDQPVAPVIAIPQLSQAQQDTWVAALTGSKWSDPLTAFNQWYTDLAGIAPDVAGSLSQGQWHSIFNTIEQSFAADPNTSWKGSSGLTMFNKLISQPSNILATDTLYYYDGSKVLQWLNGKVTDVTNQFVPPSPPVTTSSGGPLPIPNPPGQQITRFVSGAMPPNTTFTPSLNPLVLKK